MRTKSKNFNDDQVKGILPDGSIYLKMGVTKKHYNDKLHYDDMDQINQYVINADKTAKFYILTGINPITEEDGK